MQILPELWFQEQNFEDNFLFETTTDVTNYAGFELIANSKLECVLAIRQAISQLNYFMNQG